MVTKATHSQLKRHNLQLVLRSVSRDGYNNRAAIARETGLTKPAVSDLVAELINDGLLVESGQGESHGGKRPTLLEFVPGARTVIGLSMVEGEVRAVLTDLTGQILLRHIVNIGQTDDRTAIAALGDAIEALEVQSDVPIVGIGLGLPGLIDPETGVVRCSAHTGWHDFELISLLRKRFRYPMYLGNDADMAAFGQLAFGTLGDVKTLVTLVINQGLGAGLVINRRIYHGAGEIGHMIVDQPHVDDLMCSCGRRGCLETRLGWSYIKRRVQSLIIQYPNSMLNDGGKITYTYIYRAIANRDPAATILVDEIAHYLAICYAWFMSLLQPDHITLVGGMAELGTPFMELLGRKLSEMVLPYMLEQVRFTQTSSPDVVALGAVAQTLNRELGLI